MGEKPLHVRVAEALGWKWKRSFSVTVLECGPALQPGPEEGR